MRGCLLFPAALLGGLTIGGLVTATLLLLTGEQRLASLVGTAVFLYSAVLAMVYGSLWAARPDDLLPPSVSASTEELWHWQKSQSKLQTAELRVAMIFGMIGGGMTKTTEASDVLVGVAAVVSALMGGLVGYDLKRRARRMRDRLEETEQSRSPQLPATGGPGERKP